MPSSVGEDGGAPIKLVEFFTSINWMASLTPAAAVIPVPIAYLKVVAVFASINWIISLVPAVAVIPFPISYITVY